VERERHALFQVLVGQASGSSANRPTSSEMDTVILLFNSLVDFSSRDLLIVQVCNIEIYERIPEIPLQIEQFPNKQRM